MGGGRAGGIGSMPSLLSSELSRVSEGFRTTFRSMDGEAFTLSYGDFS